MTFCDAIFTSATTPADPIHYRESLVWGRESANWLVEHRTSRTGDCPAVVCQQV